MAEVVGKLAKLPLAHQPGTVWDYSMSVDVLGRVLEVVADMPLDQIIAEKSGRLAPPKQDKCSTGRVCSPPRGWR